MTKIIAVVLFAFSTTASAQAILAFKKADDGSGIAITVLKCENGGPKAFLMSGRNTPAGSGCVKDGEKKGEIMIVWDKTASMIMQQKTTTYPINAFNWIGLD